ncbi:MAG: MarR family winged helix-turn-helix transcriptional regulator [Pseudomonadota bacterium]
MQKVELSASKALKLWHDVSLALVRDDTQDLTQRQLAILLVVYLEPPPHTVRGLARYLGVTKPVITRALDTMGRMKLLERRRDERDRRNVVIRRTVDGALYVEKLADLLSEKAGEL